MQYPPNMDPLIIPLCDAINSLPDTHTKFSCQGHFGEDWNRETYVLLESKLPTCINLLIEAFKPVRQVGNSKFQDKIGDWDYDDWGIELDYEDNELWDCPQQHCVQDRDMIRVCLRRKTLYTTDEELKKSLEHKVWRINQLRNYYKI